MFAPARYSWAAAAVNVGIDTGGQSGPIAAGFLVHKSSVQYKSGVYQSVKDGPMLGASGIGKVVEGGVPYCRYQAPPPLPHANSENKGRAGTGGFIKIVRAYDMRNRTKASPAA